MLCNATAVISLRVCGGVSVWVCELQQHDVHQEAVFQAAAALLDHVLRRATE